MAETHTETYEVMLESGLLDGAILDSPEAIIGDWIVIADTEASDSIFLYDATDRCDSLGRRIFYFTGTIRDSRDVVPSDRTGYTSRGGHPGNRWTGWLAKR